MSDQLTLAELRRFDTAHEAELAASALEAAGIECAVRNAFVAGANPELGIASGGVTLLVRSDEIDAAREIIDQQGDESGGAATLEPSSGEWRCAGCDRPLKSASATCPACDAVPGRQILTPKRTRWAIVRVKLWVLGITLALIAAPLVWERFAALPEKSVEMAAYGVVAVIIGLLLVKALAASDRRL